MYLEQTSTELPKEGQEGVIKFRNMFKECVLDSWRIKLRINWILQKKGQKR